MADNRVIFVADFTCPFSYVTETGLRRVLDPLVEVRYLAYELYPAPVPLPQPDEHPPWLEPLMPLAAAVGITLEPPGAVPRTRKAHEASRLAAAHGREAALRDAIYTAYWRDQLDIGRIDVLVELGRVTGLDEDSMKIALDIDAAADQVSAERDSASQAGLTQTPTLIVGTASDAVVHVGARSVEDLRRLLPSTWADR